MLDLKLEVGGMDSKKKKNIDFFGKGKTDKKDT